MLIQNYRCLWTEFYPISSDIIEIGLSHINLFSIDKRYRLCKYQRCVDWCMFKVINLQWQYNDRWIFRKYTSLVAINYMCLNKRNLKNTFGFLDLFSSFAPLFGYSWPSGFVRFLFRHGALSMQILSQTQLTRAELWPKQKSNTTFSI